MDLRAPQPAAESAEPGATESAEPGAIESVAAEAGATEPEPEPAEAGPAEAGPAGAAESVATEARPPEPTEPGATESVATEPEPEPAEAEPDPAETAETAEPAETEPAETEPETGETGPETAETEPEPTSALAAPDPRDPVLVHLVWEAALAGVLAALVVAALVLLPAVRSTSFFAHVLGAAAPVGVLAMAFSLSLRGAVPNLAVVPLGALAGAMYAATLGDVGTTGAGLRALAVAAVLGLLIGVLAVGLRLPSWAASVAVGLLATGLAVSVAPEEGLVSAVPPFATGRVREFAVFAVVSIGAGLLCLVPRVRRTLGAYRDDPGVRAGVVAVLVLVASSVVAGVGGLLLVFGSGSSSPGIALELWLPLAAVVLGGASLYGRRVGVTGTVLGVLLLIAVREVWLASDAEPAVTGAGVVLALAGIGGIVGLLATPLVEWSGRRAGARRSP